MINQRVETNDMTRVTFSLEDDRQLSVVGDFNRWDPLKNPLVRRSNGMRSTVVCVPSGSELRFRYLADDGSFFDDPDADQLEPNGYGSTHSVVRTTC